MRVKCTSCEALVINGFPSHELGCTGSFIFTDERGKQFTKFKVWSFDTWGNPKDGFEVNDRRHIGFIYLPDDAGHRETVTALKKIGFLNKKARLTSYETEWDDSTHCVIEWTKTGEPLGELEAL